MNQRTTSLLVALSLLLVSAGASAGLAIPSPEEARSGLVRETADSRNAAERDTSSNGALSLTGGGGGWSAWDNVPAPTSVASGNVEVTDCGDRTPHPPIVIQGNTMFKLGIAVGVVNPEADGTADDPYIIEGWCVMPGAFGDTRGLPLFFTAHNARERGIAIADTDAYVIVRDNLIAGTADGRTDRFQKGVALDNVKNAEIVGNTIVNTGLDGISLIASNSVTIRDNVVAGTIYAVHAEGTSSLATVLGNRVGVTPIGSATGITVHGNVLNDNLFGVAGQWLHAITIHDNTMTGESIVGGIAFSQVDDAILYNNTASGTFYGLFLYQSHRAILLNNDLGVTGLIVEGDRLEQYEHTIDASNTVGGEPIRYIYSQADVVIVEPAGQVFLAGTMRAQVNGLDLSGPRYGIDARSGAAYGIVIAFAKDTTISDTAIGGSHTGIRIHDSIGTVISSSALVGSGTTIYGFNLDGLSLHNNTVSDGNYGLYVYAVQGLDVRDNTIANMLYGMIVYSATGLDVHDNIISNNLYGISLSSAQEAVVLGNSISGNTVGGLMLDATRVDARNNWWGRADGPSSGMEEVVDACTGTLAKGSGDRVTAEPMLSDSGERQAWWPLANDVAKVVHEVNSEVCFEPWLAVPNPHAGVA